MSNKLLINLSFLTPEPTGIGTYAANLFPQLEKLEPTLLTSQKIDNYSCYQIPDNITPDRGPKGQINRLLWTQFDLPKIYKKLQSNLIFSPIPEAPLYSGCRYIVTVHDLIPLRFPKKFSRLTAYFRYYIPQVLRQAEHIICDSESTARDVAKFYKIPHHKMTAILLACDNINFRYLDLPAKNYFLYTGRHDPYKNLERLIVAFASLPDRTNYELWLAGPPNAYTPQLIAQVEHLGLQSSIKFLGYVSYSQLPVLMNQAIALVFPTLWEGFGLPILEAMACGTPVITSNLSSMPEVAGDAALLVNPYSVPEIAAAMQTVATDSKVRSNLKKSSLARSAEFSWHKTGTATANIIQQYL
ncbi:MAG: glycosyltransferase family 4 protein [Microcoleus sp. PH2017_10_PVI_O_A]|uniref:glycosyltransferase family 4 protein n=1 Tax=unclassified Microcoleus TaxID=2642155 RepID=UPI001DCBC176|nr:MULTISPECIES: glycosyltransferase family 1 protein [unclassified Microcoleus]TAE83867.1 MAG: glycosyltransferase family 1 protein [Oscillatoriales cyanobacterium]MCC3405734.1 glycosyltransferase family 4 protein [Microcoleus sp. PH2017_10_PVI_O_A]MCC3459752.1 glycosyltransferase family 4 protein [Microcoleus sp. PH2017_11_PCY_U_A]MCC3477742.1 glycosyltransferase family 4 protein [Microcoleus sp. PH2017_12_PCY_D_A]MCC3529328.1 glycosyltransferase family 4 protein [Microcoleus sp. PH2017_21_R